MQQASSCYHVLSTTVDCTLILWTKVKLSLRSFSQVYWHSNRQIMHTKKLIVNLLDLESTMYHTYRSICEDISWRNKWEGKTLNKVERTSQKQPKDKEVWGKSRAVLPTHLYCLLVNTSTLMPLVLMSFADIRTYLRWLSSKSARPSVPHQDCWDI